RPTNSYIRSRLEIASTESILTTSTLKLRTCTYTNSSGPRSDPKSWKRSSGEKRGSTDEDPDPPDGSREHLRPRHGTKRAVLRDARIREVRGSNLRRGRRSVARSRLGRRPPVSRRVHEDSRRPSGALPRHHPVPRSPHGR